MKLTLSTDSAAPNLAGDVQSALPRIPHVRSEFLLVCEAWSTSLDDGCWRFTLETAGGELVLDADDREFGDLNRLTLLAAVRGLEAIEGASSVTLISNNRYLIRSLSDSLPRWRANNYVWDNFGRQIDVQHADLWRRVDSALQIHRVEACLVSSRLVSQGVEPAGAKSLDGSIQRVDAPHVDANGPIVPTPASQPSQDRLRKWLLSGNGSPTITRRFTSQDLLETA